MKPQSFSLPLVFSVLAATLLSLLLTACGGGGGSSGDSTTQSYTIGGAVTGLNGTLVLQNNSGDDLSLNANGSFAFNTPIISGDSYAVTVLTQPAGQSCTVSNGSGTVTTDVSNISVNCLTIFTIGGTVTGLTGTLVLQNNSGDDLSLNASGSFTFNTPIISGDSYAVTVLTQPTGQRCAVNNDSGTASANVTNVAVGCVSSTWTWMGGSNVINQFGVYGTLGVADPANIPGMRTGAISWTDAIGNQWLFGGQGYTSSGQIGRLNDLWKFDGTNWTWMGGSNTTGQPGVYGTLGVADPANIPGARSESVSWTDASGNLWLFGGDNSSFVNTFNFYNDLWKFDGTNWTWMGGSSVTKQPGVYGTLGVANAANIPGGRTGATNWKDSSGNLWLFGGEGYDSSSVYSKMNDLWKFDIVANKWTWMSGSNNASFSTAVYGVQGVADAANVPGGRTGAVSWTGPSGNLWLFGGYGFIDWQANKYHNDLWMFDVTTNQWTWVNGSSAGNQFGVYGTLGVADAANLPGGQNLAKSWKDSSGNLWLFGGDGYDSAGSTGKLNSLWKFDGIYWIWMGGNKVVNQSGIYGTQGVADVNNTPGGRYNFMYWKDATDNLWLFGGNGYDSNGTYGRLTDLWRFQP